ncbi:MAG TPA: class I SAM-dependent methyltransferase, partial [Chloroflexi bacterium]|nr:class I SAM-dependent methyltransferase [Chloroflexota bacterium]
MSGFDHFDLLAPLYDRLIRPPANSRLQEVAGLPIQGRLLDLGGGTGRITSRLHGMAGMLLVADTSRKMLKEAQQKGGLLAVACEAEQLPFRKESFERILIVDAFHHLADQRASLEECLRVLAPAGWLVIEEPDIDRFAVKLIALAERLALFRSRFWRAEAIASKLQ